MTRPGTTRRVHFLLPGATTRPVGGYKVVYEYANALAEQGVDVTIWHSQIFNAPGVGLRRALRRLRLAAGWAVRVRSTSGQYAGPTWFTLDSRIRVRSGALMPRMPLGRGDLVIATAVQTFRSAAQQARRAGAISLGLIQHFETWASPAQAIRSDWARVDERIVIAPWLADECAAAGLSSVLLPNALDASSFPPGSPLPDRRKEVLSLLSPHEYKRPDVVTEALEEIVRRRPDITVRAFGQDPQMPIASDSISYSPNPSPDQLRGLYAATRVYLCGSDAEGWHLPPAEATLCGAAVVSTDIGGVRASMADDALYVPAGDAVGLAELAIRVVDAPEEAQLRVERARRRLLETTYEGNASRLLQIASDVKARKFSVIGDPS
ncbi:glycosyltransferase family 4 protein [Microbacterium sp. Gd 4-13]|uniref:glycosyltransferase family 4 protein n=1 Tax=Microbacterium sp. Gd 4-13 TaxID=2173179 RepID=UPI0014020AA6|nr:glycosyltransferase family 4 protein [Microbacterium sp. Gd 4-13]